MGFRLSDKESLPLHRVSNLLLPHSMVLDVFPHVKARLNFKLKAPNIPLPRVQTDIIRYLAYTTVACSHITIDQVRRSSSR
jgi:hypothetical protein